MKLNPAKVSFGRHESFPLRFGWITKGLQALRDDPNVFTKEDATVTLGVGKNMVAAIRYWLLATGMVGRTMRQGLARTAIGEILFPDGKGGDHYLEDDATLWLLHWLLATNPAGATAVYWFYNHFHKPEFVSEEAFGSLREYVWQSGIKAAAVTLKNDANLVLRMYSQSCGGTRLLPEDALDSPLAALQLQERLDQHTWNAPPRDRDEIPLPTFAYAVASVFDHAGADQLTVEQLMYSDQEHCAPGSVFRLTENGLTNKLEALCEIYPNSLQLNRTAGLYQLYRTGPLEGLRILEDHYEAAVSESSWCALKGELQNGTKAAHENGTKAAHEMGAVA